MTGSCGVFIGEGKCFNSCNESLFLAGRPNKVGAKKIEEGDEQLSRHVSP